MSSFTCVICGSGILTNRKNVDACLSCIDSRPHEVRAYRLEQELDEQNQRLKDAEEVIAFYAEFDNWSEADGNNNVYDQIREDHSINGCGCNPICQCPKVGGKRARDYQKKYSNTNIQPKEAE